MIFFVYRKGKILFNFIVALFAIFVSFNVNSQVNMPSIQGNETRLQTQASGWRIQCANDDQKLNFYHCAFLQEIYAVREKAKISAMEIDVNGSVKRLIFTVPAGVDLEAGLDIYLDDKKIIHQSYSTCYASNCISIWLFNDLEWQSFLKSTQLAFVFQDMQSKQFRIDTAVNQFTEVYNKLFTSGLFAVKDALRNDKIDTVNESSIKNNNGSLGNVASKIELLNSTPEVMHEVKISGIFVFFLIVIITYVTLKLFLPIQMMACEGVIFSKFQRVELKRTTSDISKFVISILNYVFKVLSAIFFDIKSFFLNLQNKILTPPIAINDSLKIDKSSVTVDGSASATGLSMDLSEQPQAMDRPILSPDLGAPVEGNSQQVSDVLCDVSSAQPNGDDKSAPIDLKTIVENLHKSHKE